MNIYFNDFFELDEVVLEEYGAFNISLINDLPLFIDPFLLFGSEKKEYKVLHEKIIQYLKFLKQSTTKENIPDSFLQSFFLFPEIKQNWLGYSTSGNSGRGLGRKFGISLMNSFQRVFNDLGNEEITETSHLEKACLFQVGVGRDNISDFSTNLIKEYLLDYTQEFAIQNIDRKFLKRFNVNKVYFDYKMKRWMPKSYILPALEYDYVLLTPRDILTKDDTWINSNDLRNRFMGICNSLPNEQLRYEINSYFLRQLPVKEGDKKHSQKELSEAVVKTISKYPEVVDYYIKQKEENKNRAKYVAEDKVKSTEEIYIKKLGSFIDELKELTEFYSIPCTTSYDESMKRVKYLKHFIENNDGYRIFYLKGEPIKQEEKLQLIFRLAWFASKYDVNREVNNGRGSADYVISIGSEDKTIVEFKLASNKKLRQNLIHQVDIYEKANNTKSSIKVILYFDSDELSKVTKILKELNMQNDPNVILINAEKKQSASLVK